MCGWQAIAVKTGGLVAKLRSLPQPITRELLADPALKLAPALALFLYGVAMAEPSIVAA